MFRLFLILNFLLLNLFACKGGYDSCVKKIIHSNTIINQSLQIPVINDKRILFTKDIPNATILKHDPFLSLYLVKDKKPFKYPFKINKHLLLGIASVNDKKSVEGKIAKQQVGLNSFASFNEVVSAPSLITNSCCTLEGIVTPKGIIQRAYIERFLSKEPVSYSDISIRVKDTKKGVMVEYSDPFAKDNPFKTGDIILTYDATKVKNSALFMRNLLFSKIASEHKIKIKRASKVLSFSVKTTKRYGGGFISDTFLEQKGIYFDKDLKIIRLDANRKDYGLKLGDRLIQVNAVKVKSTTDVLKNISNFKNFSSLLFLRDGFEFFVKIKKYKIQEPFYKQ